jgi:hypothetical protein
VDRAALGEVAPDLVRDTPGRLLWQADLSKRGFYLFAPTHEEVNEFSILLWLSIKDRCPSTIPHAVKTTSRSGALIAYS